MQCLYHSDMGWEPDYQCSPHLYPASRLWPLAWIMWGPAHGPHGQPGLCLHPDHHLPLPPPPLLLDLHPDLLRGSRQLGEEQEVQPQAQSKH